MRQEANCQTLQRRMRMIRRVTIKREIGMGMGHCAPIKMVCMIKHSSRSVITQKEYYKHQLTGIYQNSLHISSVSRGKISNNIDKTMFMCCFFIF